MHGISDSIIECGASRQLDNCRQYDYQPLCNWKSSNYSRGYANCYIRTQQPVSCSDRSHGYSPPRWKNVPRRPISRGYIHVIHYRQSGKSNRYEYPQSVCNAEGQCGSQIFHNEYAYRCNEKYDGVCVLGDSELNAARRDRRQFFDLRDHARRHDAASRISAAARRSGSFPETLSAISCRGDARPPQFSSIARLSGDPRTGSRRLRF